ncbi:MAG: transporter substrate-binding domain-containing protein [Oscillospiraceae bacterium]|jgi:putative glutamine transport system substrate-binding protein|nr:transporter substrate-binding domain-containing protein [Oscillospiraceae bacterium]
MKQNLSRILTLALALMLVLTAFASAETVDPAIAAIQARGKLLVGVKADVPGFGYQELGGDFEGLEIDLAKKLAQKILGDPNKIEFTAVTAKTRGPLLDTGELDLILATFTIMPDRLLQYDFSAPYFVDAVGLLVKKDGGLASFADFDGKTVGVAQSSSTRAALEPAAEELGIKVEFLEFPTYPDIKAALDSGRVDCFSVDKAILTGYVDDTVVLLADSFNAQPYGAALKKGNAGLLAVVDELIAQLRASGEMDELMAKNDRPEVNWDEVDAYHESLWAEAEALAAQQ